MSGGDDGDKLSHNISAHSWFSNQDVDLVIMTDARLEVGGGVEWDVMSDESLNLNFRFEKQFMEAFSLYVGVEEGLINYLEALGVVVVLERASDWLWKRKILIF